MIVPTLAAKRPQAAFVVMLAGVGVTGGELELLQSRLLATARDADPEALAYEQETIRRWIALVEAGAMPDAIERALQPRIVVATRTDPTAAERWQSRLHSEWWRCVLTHSAIPDLEKLRCPVMALNGSRDVQVPPRENLVPIAEALARAGNTDVLIRELPGLNHLFQHAQTGSEEEYQTISETLAPEVLALVGQWVLDHVGSAEPGGRAAAGR